MIRGIASIAKLDMTSVPYKGGPQVVNDMLGGRIHFHIGTTST